MICAELGLFYSGVEIPSRNRVDSDPTHVMGNES